jgi:hypothetical protein
MDAEVVGLYSTQHLTMPVALQYRIYEVYHIFKNGLIHSFQNNLESRQAQDSKHIPITIADPGVIYKYEICNSCDAVGIF